MTSERVCDQAEAYAIGALDRVEASLFEAHAAACPECRRVVAAQREATLALAQAAAQEPPAGLRARVLAIPRAARSPGAARERGGRRWPGALALAAGVAGLMLGGVQTVRLARLSGELAAVMDSLSRRDHRLAEVLAQRNAVLNNDIRLYVLASQDTAAASPGPGGQIYWSREARSWLLHAFNLPRLSEGRVYQLWYVTADARISAGILSPDEEGHAVLLTRVPAEAATAVLGAISVEPAGGSPQPTGPIVLAGSVAERS
jgi:anti-sigma-K factor RskA